MSLTICDVWGVIGTHSASHPALPTIVSAVVARPNAVFWAVEKSWCIPAVYRYTADTPRAAPLAEVYSSTAVYSIQLYSGLQYTTVYIPPLVIYGRLHYAGMSVAQAARGAGAGRDAGR